MMDTKAAFCLININQMASLESDHKGAEEDSYNIGTGILRRLYEVQARYKMYRTQVFRLVFVVYLKHLDDKLKRELANLDRESRDYVVTGAVGRIFEQVDKRYFLLSVKPLLKWRFEQ
jgi:hypothetical protein